MRDPLASFTQPGWFDDMNTRLFLVSIAATLLACAIEGCSHNYALQFAHESIGHVSCEDLEMVVYGWDKDPNTGLWSWRVACGAHRYKCYGGSGYIAKCADKQK